MSQVLVCHTLNCIIQELQRCWLEYLNYWQLMSKYTKGQTMHYVCMHCKDVALDRWVKTWNNSNKYFGICMSLPLISSHFPTPPPPPKSRCLGAKLKQCRCQLQIDEWLEQGGQMKWLDQKQSFIVQPVFFVSRFPFVWSWAQCSPLIIADLGNAIWF